MYKCNEVFFCLMDVEDNVDDVLIYLLDFSDIDEVVRSIKFKKVF